MNVNGAVYWVNGSVHGYKGHECVDIIKCVCACCCAYVCLAET